LSFSQYYKPQSDPTDIKPIRDESQKYNNRSKDSPFPVLKTIFMPAVLREETNGQNPQIKSKKSIRFYTL